MASWMGWLFSYLIAASMGSSAMCSKYGGVTRHLEIPALSGVFFHFSENHDISILYIWMIFLTTSHRFPSLGDAELIWEIIWGKATMVSTVDLLLKSLNPFQWSFVSGRITILFLVGGLEHFLFFHILGMSSSQLTKSIIFQWGRKTTNQILTEKKSVGWIPMISPFRKCDDGFRSHRRQQVVGGLVSFSVTLRDLIHAMGEWPKKQQQLDKPQMDVSVVAKAVTFV